MRKEHVKIINYIKLHPETLNVRAVSEVILYTSSDLINFLPMSFMILHCIYEKLLIDLFCGQYKNINI
jgi:hypothetical protein